MAQKTPLQRKKRLAWDKFSLWIRNRDGKCVTCGSINDLQGGHFWHGVLDFDEENINAQCKKCNHFLSGNLAVYATYLLKKLGKEGFDALDIRHTRAIGGEGHDIEFYQSIIDKYDKEKTTRNRRS